MKCQILFSGNYIFLIFPRKQDLTFLANKKNISKCRLLKILILLSVNQCIRRADSREQFGFCHVLHRCYVCQSLDAL